MWYEHMIDGFVLPRSPWDILATGQQAPVPLIVGDVIREFPSEGTPDYAKAMIAQYHPKRRAEALKLYGLDGATPPPDDPALGSAATQVGTDAVIRCPSSRIAALHAKSGFATWRYQLAVAMPGSNKPAEHNADLQYVFDAAPADATFSTWPPLQPYWTNFAATGNPNAAGLPLWNPLGRDAAYLAFTTEGPVLGSDLRGSVCRVLNAY
jgi:para-nitrobenzyl esterase